MAYLGSLDITWGVDRWFVAITVVSTLIFFLLVDIHAYADRHGEQRT